MLLHQRLLKLVVGRVTNNCSKNRQRLTTHSARMSSNQSAKVIAISQMRATNDKAANMRHVEELVAKAKSQSATILFLPECCDFVGEHRKQTLELSEPLTGATMQQYRELAKRNNIWLSLGGIHESVLDENACKTDKIYNAHVLVNDCGEVVNVYRKLHLFDVDTSEFRFKESDVVTPGVKLVPPVSTPIGAIGLQICYDVRFAEAAILLRKAGAQILTYPAAFAYSTGKAHWEILLRARAIENQCFVVAAAQVGFHNAKRQSWGHGMIVDPWGKVLADCGPESELTVATAEIDLSKIDSIKQNMPCFSHRRGDVYALTAYGVGSVDAAQDHHFASNTIRKETIFYETEHCFAFTNLRCVVTGHVLIATKRIMKRLSDLRCDEMCDLFAAVNKIQRMLEAFYKTSSATVTVQDGPDAGQTVPHVHFHVMPRQKEDFGENDQIYRAMDDRCLDQPDRSMQERIEEAQKYRDFLSTQQ